MDDDSFCTEADHLELGEGQVQSRTPTSGPAMWWSDNAQALADCSVNVHRLIPIQPGAHVDSYHNGDDDHSIWTTMLGARHQVYCASPFFPDPNWAGMIDHYMWILTEYSRPTSVAVSLFTKPITNPTSNGCTLPYPYSDTHRCLELGFEETLERTTATQKVRHAIPVPNGCFTLTGYSQADVLWVSDSDPYVDEYTEYPDASMWVPRAYYARFYADEQDGTFTRHFCNTGDEQHFIWVYSLLLPDEGYPYVQTRFDITFDWVDNIPFEDLTPDSFAGTLFNSVTLSTGDKKFENFNEGVPYFTSYNTGQLNIRALWPSESPSFYANPPWYLRYDPCFGQTTDTRVYPRVPNKFAVGVLLDHDFNNIYQIETVLPRKYQYLTREEFFAANLTLHGAFGNEDMEVVHTTILSEDFEEKKITCDPVEFMKISAQVTEKLKEVMNPTSDIRSLAFSIEMLTQEDVYIACKEEMLSRTATEDGPTFAYETTDCLFDIGTEEYEKDPCCNINIDAYDSCFKKVREMTYPVLVEMDVEIFEGVCANPECARLNTMKYADELIRVNTPDGCRSRLPQETTFLQEQLQITYLCRDQFFNVLPSFGLDCQHDDDCPTGTLCSSLGDGCVINFEQQLDNYLECVLENTSTFLTHTIADMLSVEFEDMSVETIKEAFSEDACVDPAGYKVAAFPRIFEPLCFSPDQCTVAFQFDVSNAAWPYLDCLLGCSLSFDKIPLDEFCDDQFCNWDSCEGLNDTQCETLCTSPAQDHFCGICDNEMNCEETNLGLDSSNCDDTIVCILNDGERVITSTEEECRSMMRCSDPSVTDESLCVAPHHCTDSTDRIHGPFTGSFSGLTGICQYELRAPEPWPKANEFCFGFWAGTVLGCLDTNIAQENCTAQNMGFDDFEIIHVKWLTPAQTKEACEAVNACRGPPVGEIGAADDWTLSKEQCTDPTWSWEPYFKWLPDNTWRGGQPRRTVWKERAYEPRWVAGDVFNFENWMQVYEDAVKTQYFQSFQSFVYCQHSKSNQLLEWLVCNCQEGDAAGNCFEDDAMIFSDIGTFCGGNEITIVAPPFTLTFPDDSLPGTDCTTMYFSPESIFTFKDSGVKPHLSNVVINFEEDATWAVRNQNNAIWGKVLTDGIYVTTMGDVEEFSSVSMSVKMALDRMDPDFEEFPILDIAYSEGNGMELTPMNIDVALDGDNFIYTLTTDVFTTNRTYFIVQRVENWDTLERTVFTGGEIAYMSVVLFLYVSLFLLSVFKLGRGIQVVVGEGNLPMNRLLGIMALMTVFCIFRIVLFSILLSHKIVDVTSGGLYVLIEFPILLYFIYITNYIIMWAYIRRNSSKLAGFTKSWVRTVNLITIILNLFILFLFVTIIILYEELVGTPELICDGQVVFWDDNVAYIIGLVYRCVFGGIDIVIGLSFLFIGYSFSEVLDNVSSRQKHLRTKVLGATFIGSFGLVAQGIVWIIFPAIRQQQSNYLSLSILIVVEIIPTFLLLLLIREKSIKANTTMSRSRKTTTTNSKKKSSSSTR
eukprot:TRINITY_DN2950_c0_g1_i5.p1 TRINITY_DN2950_c0_g1~~TRINITY_DN2950_c0_g1_i5.p1  ORF type:complete len:1521 (-),score=316.91 TRINITY_DN2950_c0_g1_i5:116-4678(-)